jgi:hypothetical protein
MTRVEVIVASAEEADFSHAELWSGGELLAVTVLHEERLHVRIAPRPDGAPWLIDAASLALAIQDAARRIAAY